MMTATTEAHAHLGLEATGEWTLVDWVLAVLLGVTALALHLPLLDEPVGYMDEGLLLVYPLLLRDGLRMHLDFQTGYGPGAFWILDGWFRVFGTDIVAERLFAFAVRVGLVVMVFALLRRFGRVAGVGCAVASLLCVVVMSPRASTWLTASVFLMAALLLLVKKPAIGVVGAFFAGVLMAVAMTIRLDTVALAAVVAAGVAAFVHPRRIWLAVVAGIALGLIPMGVHVVSAGVVAVYDNMFVDPVIRTAPGRVLPFPASNDANFLRLWVMGGAVAAGLLFAAFQRRPRDASAVLAAMVAACLFAYVIQRADRNHFALGLAVVFPLVAFAVLSSVRWKGAGVVAGCALPILAAIVFRDGLMGETPSYRANSFALNRSVRVENRGRWLPVPPEAAAAYRATLDTVESIQGARTVYIAPEVLRTTPYNDLQLYFLLPQLRPSGYYFEMNPGCTNRQGSRLPEDIGAADVLILGTKFNDWYEPNASTRPGSSDAEKVVQRDFVLLADHGLFKVYTNRRMEITR